jgi:metal-responsive CopG/Arc/MetJ family transcriptional regulator
LFGRYSIKLDKNFYIKALQFSKKKGYSSLKEFIQHAIDNEIERNQEEEDDETKNRLKGLGYISK